MTLCGLLVLAAVATSASADNDAKVWPHEHNQVSWLQLIASHLC